VLSIYLPPSYQSQPERHYKVLYSNDGQDLPIMFLEQDLNSFYASGLMQQVIVVGIPANDNRIYEYGTGSIKNTDGWGANAQAYLNFVLKEVIPLVNSKYRTLTGPENTAYVGWSLGGLTSFYTAWTHPEVFGTAGAISGSFWWEQILTIYRNCSPPGLPRSWFAKAPPIPSCVSGFRLAPTK